ncbi:uncharacterized protein N7529_009734 [Penicillium soppii]|uniref:uncharacterized protein n=1 Tax=Penicillium soppii TaxID=69789 RepID=UPI0025498F74|nr:uncharacterized protein N7529_009734 [Penicillium soppii]KAJ5855790.1 hypothetical protein N7529_009734 [Penicillium soppii]
MPPTNIALQELSESVFWLVFTIWLGSVTFVVAHWIVRVGQAAVIYHIAKILYYYHYQEDTFFHSLAQILSLRFDPKSFFFLSALVSIIYQSTKEIVLLFHEKILHTPHLTISCGCELCPPEAISTMQSPRLTPSPSPPRSSGVHWELPSLSNSGSETLACANEFSTSYLSQSSRHPWGVIDYHIYLTHAEKNRDKQHRLRECYLVEQDGINNVILQNNMSLSNVAHNTNPTILFMNLPIPCHNRHSKLILGFDPITQNLLGYLFETDSPIEDYGDLWFNWKRNVGQLVIDLPVERFLEIVQETLTTNIEVLEIGILHHYAATTKALPAGIDMMVVIQLLQFIDDFADMIWVDGSKMREEYGECQKTLRDIVLTGSRQAWFSVRDGTGTSTIEEFRQESLRKVAGAALWYGQSVVDLRDQAAKFGSQFSQPRVKTFNDRLAYSELGMASMDSIHSRGSEDEYVWIDASQAGDPATSIAPMDFFHWTGIENGSG